MQTSFVVKQSMHLQGNIYTSGAKNAVLVMMCSSLLTRGIVLLQNVPLIEDVYVLAQVLQELGAEIYIDEESHAIGINTKNVTGHAVSKDLMKKMRASVLVLGPLLATLGKAELAFPGGDAIGKRPIDFHLQGFEKMGATCKIDDQGVLLVTAEKKLQPGTFVFDYPSVGATENILMACCLLDGTSTIVNAALEPEVLDLINLLQQMGAQISVQAPGVIHITGVSRLHGTHYCVLNDRLQTGTYAIAAALTQGDICIKNADPAVHQLLIAKLQGMGHRVETTHGLRVIGSSQQKPFCVRTEPYPGFPTDLQSCMLVLATQSHGKSWIRETVYENRFQQVSDLVAMGADITVQGQYAYITGKTELQGQHTQGTDIRSAMSLVLAGLIAQGTTYVAGGSHILRGYDNVIKTLQRVGAHIQ